MKQFDWTKINPNKLKDTVWVSLDDEKINIDVNEFESIFAAAAPAEKKPGINFTPPDLSSQLVPPYTLSF